MSAFLVAVICSNCGKPFAKGPVAGEPKRTTIATLTCPSCHEQRDYDPADIVTSPTDASVQVL